MSGPSVPAGYRLGDGWRSVDQALGYVCTDDKGDKRPEGYHAALYLHADGERGACADHAVAAGALVPLVANAEPERCSCDESLALRAQLREAAAHVGELLTVRTGPSDRARVSDAARAWLKAYLAKGGA